VDIQITGRHTSVTDAMKRQANEKLGKLERHNDMLTRAEIVMNIEGERHLVECIAHTKVGGRVVGKAEHSDMYAAIDLLLDKMDHQLKKQKEKVKGERKHARTKASGEGAPAAKAKRGEAAAAGGDDEVLDE
jgi:putative sigma-54 modulation protein